MSSWHSPSNLWFGSQSSPADAESQGERLPSSQDVQGTQHYSLRLDLRGKGSLTLGGFADAAAAKRPLSVAM